MRAVLADKGLECEPPTGVGKMADIEGKNFTLFWDFDRDALRDLNFVGRIEWLRLRVNETLLRPISLLEMHIGEAFVYLAVVELVCAGIESLSDFYGNGNHGKGSQFCRFVYKFMSSDYEGEALDNEGRSISFCEHLRKYFRNGLDHGFSIQWGGLWHADEPDLTPGYLRHNKKNEGIAVCPKAFVKDFQNAVELYFQQLSKEGEHSVIGRNFTKRFKSILNQECSKRR